MTQETQTTELTSQDMLFALAAHLGIKADAVWALTEKESYTHYGLDVYTVEGDRYAVGTNAQAYAAARDYIEETLWAFKAEFILSCCELDASGAECLRALQEKACEGANDFILSLVSKTCGLDRFCEEAERSDGRGHFLSPYDGEEIELLGGKAFAYKL